MNASETRIIKTNYTCCEIQMGPRWIPQIEWSGFQQLEEILEYWKYEPSKCMNAS